MAATGNFSRQFAYQPRSRIEALHRDMLETVFVFYHDACQPSMTDPLTLASVCRGWRQTALGMHSLWSYIEVSTEKPTSFDLARECLPRCRRIFLDLKRTELSPELDDFLDAVRISQIPIKRLIINFDGACNSSPDLTNIFKHHGANLEEVTILESSDIAGLPLPNVKRLYLDNQPDSWKKSIESTQLTDLCVTMPLPEITVAGFIALLPTLLHLWVSIDEDVSHSLNYTHTAVAYTHHNLEYLGIKLDSNPMPQEFLSNFVFPALRVLEYNPQEPVLDEVQWMLTHPLLGSIKVLTLAFRPFDDDGRTSKNEEALTSILKLTHSVEELTIWCSEYFLGDILSILSDARCLLSKEKQIESEGVELALSQLKRLNLEYPPIAVGPDDFRDFARVWSRTEDVSRPYLTQLSLFVEEIEAQEAVELRDAIQQPEGSTCPIVLIRTTGIDRRVDVPKDFVMFLPAFGDSMDQFEVLRGDGSDAAWVPCNLRDM